MSTKKLKVIIAEDHNMVRKGLVNIVKSFERVIQVREAENGKDLLNQLIEELIDVVLMDLEMPLIDGMTASSEIILRYPNVKIVVLSAFEEDSIILKLLEIGVHGYLLKKAHPKDLERAIYSVYDNDFFQSELVTRVLRQGVKRKKQRVDKTGQEISEREMQVLKLLCQEFSAKEIGDKLNISEKTVHSHRLHLMEKTKAKNTVGLVLFALQQGILSHKI
jgi:two-component system response regulator DegU